jgi:rfaE bifunctional protein nucleotidyltransferase chain/domain
MRTIERLQQKVLSAAQLADQVRKWQQAGEKVVFTNGCFDLLHYGHIHYLAEARDLGDRLVIGLNADASVSRLKGAHRPIKDELGRASLLAAFSFIDGITIFAEDTPLDLIQMISPDILVKGGDWQPHQIVGADWVMSHGGSVHSLPFQEGYSTTNLEQKIIDHARDKD